VNKRYLKWLNEETLDPEILAQLQAMDAEEIEDSFYKNLSFGTGGMRGIVGAGTNRMNIYTIRKAAFGYAKFLLEKYENAASRGVVIAYDNRNKSDVFAKECLGVLTAFGIKVYLFDALRPTPQLSYTVRSKKAAGGIMVTASHNPPKYNGVKFYDDAGCQLVPALADRVIEHFNSVDNIFAIERISFEAAQNNQLVEMLTVLMDDEYIEKVHGIQLNGESDKALKIVFTPLHGASRDIGLRTLEESGYDVTPVENQMVVDPNFSTVDSPNPENPEAFEHAIIAGEKVNADILIATDPDGDRLGVMAKHNGQFKFITGNQTGAILIHYLMETLTAQGKLPENGIIYNTIVSSEFGTAIAKAYGMDVESTLTGFKFIGEKMHEIEDTKKTFVMGYEESYGYVLADFVRDKDSIQALLMISEVANQLKLQGKTLIDYLDSLYDKFGYYQDTLMNIVLEGQAGEAMIQTIMSHFRSFEPAEMLGRKLLVKEDYYHGTRKANGKSESLDGFPSSNVLKFIFEKDMWFVLRPSGTEPKLKIYINVLGESKTDGEQVVTALKKTLQDKIDALQTEKGENE